ncbi:A24 family peptidase [Desulfobacca acetoxidans]
MSDAEFLAWGQYLPMNLLPPLLLALAIAASDLHSRRIPNYLTFGGALAGLFYQTVFFGWSGLGQGLFGLLLGLGLLLIPYILGGMGAGDVKGLAALGAWLGPKGCFSLFCYMGIAGGLMSLGVLIWRGILWSFLKRGWVRFQTMVLCRGQGVLLETITPSSNQTPGIPYGMAIALGMGVLLVRGNLF